MDKPQNSIYAGTANKGDAQIWLQLNENSSELTIDLHSKSEQKYGEHLRQIIHQTAQDTGLKNGHLTVQEDGALDFVIAARVECAILRAKEKE